MFKGKYPYPASRRKARRILNAVPAMDRLAWAARELLERDNDLWGQNLLMGLEEITRMDFACGFYVLLTMLELGTEQDRKDIYDLVTEEARLLDRFAAARGSVAHRLAHCQLLRQTQPTETTR